MDITRGSFQDFCGSSARSSRATSRTSNPCSESGSLQLLSPDLGDSLHYYSNGEERQTRTSMSGDDESEYFSAEEETNVSNRSKHDKRDEINQPNTLRNSLESCSHSSNSNHSGNDTENTLNHEKLLEDFELQEAIKKMKKLDRILMKKIKLEKEVKRQRFMNQKSIHTSLAELKKVPTYSDIESNTAKYLSLLPPPQQLDVLLERNKEDVAYEPIFQTQFQCENRHSLHDNDNRPKSTTAVSDGNILRETMDKPSSAGANKSQDDHKTDYIKRNIELAKDAGNMVSMTEEEKKRLSFLLEDIDEVNIETEDSSSDMITLSSGEGYKPLQQEMEKLEFIDSRLQALLSPDVYRSISSTPRSEVSSKHMMRINRELGKKFLRSTLTETRNPQKRLEEVDEKLENLDQRWKEQFTTSSPRLTDEQLYRLLSECSRSTSPNSIVTSLESGDSVDDDDDDDDDDEGTLTPSSMSRHSYSTQETMTERIAEFDDDDRSSIHQEVILPSITRETLDELLKDARSSLGLDPLESGGSPKPDTASSDYDDDSLDGAGELNELV